MLDIVIHAVSSVLIPMFIIGMMGSAIVVLITIVHDVHDFFSPSEASAAPKVDGLTQN